MNFVHLVYNKLSDKEILLVRNKGGNLLIYLDYPADGLPIAIRKYFYINEGNKNLGVFLISHLSVPEIRTMWQIHISLSRFHLKSCSHLGVNAHPYNNHSYLCVSVLCPEKNDSFSPQRLEFYGHLSLQQFLCLFPSRDDRIGRDNASLVSDSAQINNPVKHLSFGPRTESTSTTEVS